MVPSNWVESQLSNNVPLSALPPKADIQSQRAHTTWTVINLSSAVRISAATHCSDNDLGDKGWATVIDGLSKEQL